MYDAHSNSMSSTMTAIIALLIFVLVFVYSASRLTKRVQRTKAKRIIDFLQYAKDESLRLTAFRELGQLDIKFGATRLIEGLRDANPAIREIAQSVLLTAGRNALLTLEELRRISEKSPNSLGYRLEALRENIVFRRKLDNSIVPGLIAILNESEGDARETALAALREIGTPAALAAVEQSTNVRISDSTQLSAHYPGEVIPNQWYPLVAYIYRPDAKENVSADIRTRADRNNELLRATLGQAKLPIARGSLITVTPYFDDLQVNPPQITFGFYKAWHRLDFEILAQLDLVGRTCNGTFTFTVAGVIIADLPISIYVRVAAAKLELREETRRIYQAVFCSYSHEDEEVVKRVESALRTLGVRYLRDVYSLRSGEIWNSQVLALIEEADVFQLFWSAAASNSKYVEMEWRHALKQERTNNFIRPVYWSRPLPIPPPELKHIHFCYAPYLTSP